MGNFVEIQNLSLQYKDADFKAIEQLNLSIKKGEVFGLLGPNGAGKTTLISILTGLIKPDEGKIIINDKNLFTNINSIKKIMGLVPQDYALYPKLTAKENLIFLGGLYGLRGKTLQLKVNEGLKKMGLDRFINKRIDTFSGGMKRRVNLLAGTLHKPEILLLDEPTVGVDVKSKIIIMDFLQELNQADTTIIYTSHQLHEAQKFCTRIAIIDSGKIQIEGATETILMQDGKLKSLEQIFIENTDKN